jgi:hypothetical protein
VLAALAGGASGGPSDEAAGVAVQCPGTWNTELVGILVEAIDAGTTGNSIDRGEYSVVGVLDTSGAHAGGAGTAIWAWRRRRRLCPLVVPIETPFQ